MKPICNNSSLSVIVMKALRLKRRTNWPSILRSEPPLFPFRIPDIAFAAKQTFKLRILRRPKNITFVTSTLFLNIKACVNLISLSLIRQSWKGRIRRKTCKRNLHWLQNATGNRRTNYCSFLRSLAYVQACGLASAYNHREHSSGYTNHWSPNLQNISVKAQCRALYFLSLIRFSYSQNVNRNSNIMDVTNANYWKADENKIDAKKH